MSLIGIILVKSDPDSLSVADAEDESISQIRRFVGMNLEDRSTVRKLALAILRAVPCLDKEEREILRLMTDFSKVDDEGEQS